MQDPTVRFLLLSCLPPWIIVFYVSGIAAGIIYLRILFRRQLLSANELLLWVLFVIFVPFAGFLAVILLGNSDKRSRG